MKNTNQKTIVTIILCMIFGFSVVFVIKSSLSKTYFSNYQGNFENDDPANLRLASEYVISEPISDHLWSPDGTKLAYIKPQVGQWWNCEIWVADKSPNSAELINHQLIYTGALYVGLYDWQGDWLLIRIRFEEGTPSSYYGAGEIWKIRYDGTGLIQLTFTETNGIRTTWSNTAYTNRGTASWAKFIPETNLIYFGAHNGNGWYKSFVCDDDGTDGWYHISNPDYAFRIEMSPTGNKLLWGDASYWDDPLTIRASNIDGSGRVTIKNLPGRTTIIALADGNTMIWNQNDNIYAIDLDGTNERTVIDDAYVNQAWNYNPANDQELIFGSSRLDGNMHLFKMNVDGSDVVQLTDASPYHDEAPILSPDGQYISYLRLPYDFDKLSNPQPYPYDLVVKSLIPAPIIVINSPANDANCHLIAPNYDITITGEYEAVWYTLDNGATNITASGLTGTINQTEWDKVGEGVVNLRFYVNNTLGYSSYSEVSINKDLNPLYGNDPIELLTPHPSSQISSNLLNFSWSSLDTGYGAVNFTLQVSNVTNFSNIIFQSGDIAEIPIVTNFSVPLSITQGVYYWRVKPRFGNYNGSWSSYAKFTFVVNENTPLLVLDGITPTDGTSTTIFRFTVIYSDLDNNIPEYVEILINGIHYSMEMVHPSDEDFTDGCIYQYLTLLAPSTTAYTISFECSDSAFQFSTSTYQGPLVESDSTPSNNQADDNLNSTNIFAITMTLGIAIGILIPFVAFAEKQVKKIKLGEKTSAKIKKKQIKS